MSDDKSIVRFLKELHQKFTEFCIIKTFSVFADLERIGYEKFSQIFFSHILIILESLMEMCICVDFFCKFFYSMHLRTQCFFGAPKNTASDTRYFMKASFGFFFSGLSCYQIGDRPKYGNAVITRCIWQCAYTRCFFIRLWPIYHLCTSKEREEMFSDSELISETSLKSIVFIVWRCESELYEYFVTDFARFDR